MLDSLIKTIEAKYPRLGAGAVNKLVAAKNMIIELDPGLLNSDVKTLPPPEPEPPPIAASSKKKKRKKA